LIKNDTWIRELADRGGIAPFEPQQVRREGDRPVISYGLSSFGYDIRLSPNEFRIFRHIPGTVVDPKNFNPDNLETAALHSDDSGEFFILPAHSYGLGVALERLEVPDNVTIVCLGKSTYARCFSGDTRVALVDGSAPTLEEMSERAQQGELFWGYSVNRFGRIIVTQLEAPRYIDRDSLLCITLDNNYEIRCTPDHQFLTRDGRMVPACELRPNDSLMPLYRQYQRGYEMVYQPLNGFQYPTHRLSDEWNLNQGIYQDAPNTHRHHIDRDRRNNNPWNIIRMEAQDHIKLHNDLNYGEEFDPVEHGEAVKAALERKRSNPEWVAHYSEVQQERALAFWHSPEYAERREILLAARQNMPEAQRQKHREAMLNYYQDAQARNRTSELSRKAWSEDTSGRHERQSQNMKATVDRLRTRHDITSEAVRKALHETGSIRGAARYLNCDRSVFRRFPDEIAAFRGVASAGAAKHPNNHKVKSIRELPGTHDVYCLTVPETGNFALDAGVFVHNCGIIANITPAEAAWKGYLTLEFSNSSSADCRMYAREGVVQLLFFEGDPCSVSYEDRQGKYQNQSEEVTIARI
jgi:dCTP deaminase